MVLGVFRVSNQFKLAWNLKNSPKCDQPVRSEKASPFLQRRFLMTFLGFLCSVVMHSQRLNISIAMVAMVNTTSTSTGDRNMTECPQPMTTSTKWVKPGEFNWSPDLQGYILSAGYLGYVLTQILGGILAGRFGTKPVLLSGLAVASVCNLVSPISARIHPWMLAAVTLVRGMGQGIQQPAMSVLMSKWFPRNERGFLSAFIYCGYPLGAFISSIASGSLCELEFLDGWPMVFYAFGILGILISLLVVFFFVERPFDDPRISEAELKHILQSQSHNAATARPPVPWSAMLLSLPTYALLIGLFGQYWMAFYFLSVHPTYMGTILNIPIKENGILNSGPYLTQAVSGFLACWVAFWLSRNNRDRVNLIRKGSNSLSCLVFVVGTIGVYLAGCDPLWNEICLFIATASVGFSFSGALITSVDMSPTFCGQLMGFASTIASLAGFAVPVIVGTLTKEEQTLAQWRKMFIITASVAAISGFIFQIFGSTEVQPYDPTHCKDENMNENSKDKKTQPEDDDISCRL